MVESAVRLGQTGLTSGRRALELLLWAPVKWNLAADPVTRDAPAAPEASAT